MRRKLISLTAAAILSSSAATSTEVILEDTPNVGDTTTITTITSGNPASTGNLVSQDFDDGSWVGTMFPDSSDINESTWLTGKHGKYAETTIDSDDHLSLEELQLGFTSTLVHRYDGGTLLSQQSRLHKLQPMVLIQQHRAQLFMTQQTITIKPIRILISLHLHLMHKTNTAHSL